MPPKSKIFQLRIALMDASPPIWRRILVESTITLADLHDVLQVAMGWYDCHLHMFIKQRTHYQPPNPWMDLPGDEVLDTRKYRLHQVLSKPKDWMRYRYDFGDCWDHRVTLQKVLPADPKLLLPVCLSGRRRCPPEDCGGLWGYYEMQKALADPNHEEHELWTEWIDDGFDPEEFSVHEVNAKFAQEKIGK